MTLTVQINETGAPDRLQLRDLVLREPGPGEVRVRQSFVGVNFVDIYHRKGLYPLPRYPATLGVEAVGTVEALGDGVAESTVGDRVGYAGLPAGSYTEACNLPANRLIKLPEDITDRQVAGSFLRGLTAYLLVKTVAAVRPGQTVLVHAAAGGLGLVLTQWLGLLGARTIGTVGSSEKAEIATAHGLDHAILYKREDFVTAVNELTDGAGVDYAIDGVGGDTLARTLGTLRPFGTAANIGQTGADVPPLDVHTLTNRFVIRPSVLAYLKDETAYRAAAAAWFSVLRQGVKVATGHEYPLSEAAAAHAEMEAGRTTGMVRLKV